MLNYYNNILKMQDMGVMIEQMERLLLKNLNSKIVHYS